MRRFFLTFLALFALLTYFPTFEAETLPYFNPCNSLDGMTPDVPSSQNRRWTVSGSGDFKSFTIAPHNSTTRQDAYLWLPVINFEYEHCYRFALDARTLYSNANGRFRIVMATAPSRNNIVKELLPAEEVGTMFVPADCYFTPEETQELYLGIHVTSPGPASNFYVDNLLVEEVQANVPTKVSDFKATSHKGGIKRVDLTMTAPGKNVLGGTTRSLSKIELYSDGELIHTFTSPKPNSQQSFTYEGSGSGTPSSLPERSRRGGAGAVAYVVGRVGSEIPAPDYNYDGRAFSYLATAIYQKDGDIHLSWRPRKLP